MNRGGKRVREDPQESNSVDEDMRFRSEDLNVFNSLEGRNQCDQDDCDSKAPLQQQGSDPYEHVDSKRSAASASGTPLDLHARLAKAIAYLDEAVKLPRTMELTEEVGRFVYF